MEKHYYLIFIPICLLLFCVAEYNPYYDTNKAGIHLPEYPFKVKDSIKIENKEFL